MRTLEFFGTVRKNMGKFSKEMVVPGRATLASAPSDWPLELVTGTLNVGIADDGFPENFGDIGEGDRVKKFDNGNFTPAFVIAQNEIVGNTLKPKDGQPDRGTAQVWRAKLCNLLTNETAKCWMLRRIGSGLGAQIELVSADRLRDRLNLDDGTSVRIDVFES